MILQASIYDVKRRPPEQQMALFGIRVLVTRRWLRGVSKSDVDMWLPDAGPSVQLLADYRASEIAGDEFLVRYEQEQLQQQQCRIVRYEGGERVADTVEQLSPLAWLKLLEERHGIIAVLCWEPETELCHRHRLLELMSNVMNARFV